MPRKLVLAAWDEMFPDRRPRILRPRVPTIHPFVEVPRLKSDDDSLNQIARPLAQLFLVSLMAMRIRLEKLDLLHREIPDQSRLSVPA